MDNKKIIGMDEKENMLQIKGIMATIVMLGHIAPFMANIWYIISGGIAVGVFFYYSSFGSEISLNKRKTLRNYISKKVVNIYIPFLIADILYFLSSILQNKLMISKIEYKDIILYLLGIKLSNPILWYIWHLLIFLVILYFIKKNLNKYETILYVIVYIFYIILAVLFDIGIWWYTATSCILIGLYYGKNSKKEEKNIIKFFIFITWITTVILGEIYLIKNIKLLPLSDNYYAVGLQMLVIPLFLLTLRMIMKKIKLSSYILKFLGNISFEIYLYHMLVWDWIKYYFYGNNIYLNVLITVVLTIIFSFIVKNIYKQILKNKFK
ncbi:acyltransferase [Fusobacterium sp. SYSU M8D902]|uniref:acyltransferase n=1 Tax=Fusobacterium sp. SYSU M8D902 TaxID=3159562 RepID=UPI0032E52C15